VYAQKGMWNIFIVVFCFALGLPFFSPYFFIGYLIGIAFFGLFQAIFMANAGGAWDNAKKSWKWICAKKAQTCTPPPSSATPWAILSRTPPPSR
jgi:Na+/H+-translocating membrane pyrophosphatase